MRAIFFKAYYCGTCDVIWDEVMQPLVDEGYHIEEVDAMKRPHLADRYRIKGVPALVVCEGNKPIATLRGRMTQEQIRELLAGDHED